MVNYGNGKIYKIVSSYTDMIYIGSTTKKYLSQRMDTHRQDLIKWMNNKRNFVSSYPILLYEDARIVLLETYPCTCIDELRAREQHYINLYCDIVVNHHKAYTGLNKKEYHKQYDKQFYKNNKENKKQSAIQRYYANKKQINQKNDCVCGGKYTTNNKVKHENTQKHQDYINNLI